MNRRSFISATPFAVFGNTFAYPNLAKAAFDDDNYYLILARHSGLSLDVRDAAGDLAVVQTAGIGDQPNREWKFNSIGDDYYNIVSRHSGKSLDVRDAGGDLALVQTAGNGGQSNREWKLVAVPGGYYEIFARHSGKSLDVQNADGEMALLQTAGQGGQDNRNFAIIPASDMRQLVSYEMYTAKNLLDPKEFLETCTSCGIDAKTFISLGDKVGGWKGAAIAGVAAAMTSMPAESA